MDTSTIVYLTHTRGIPDKTIDAFNSIYRDCEHKIVEYDTGLSYEIMKSVKMDAFIRCVRHAYSRKCERMVVLADDFKILSDIEESESYDVVRIDTGIGQACWSLSADSIAALYRIKTSPVDARFERSVMDCLSRFHIEQIDCVEHLIDYVVTYVDDEDPVWREQKRMFNKIEMRSRFSSNGMIDTHLSLIRKNLPFINNLYLIVSFESQLSNITSTDFIPVFHDKIINPKNLPTFNSSTIEMSLCNIPGLSEQFIYANDDMYVMRRLSPSDFYIDGRPRLSFHELDKSMSGFYYRCLNSHKIASSEIKDSYIENELLVPDHTISPMLLSSCEHIWSLHKNEINKSITRFRDKKNINQYVFSIYDKLSGKTSDSDLRFKYISLDSIENSDSLIDVDVCCINDSSYIEDRSELNSKITKLIESTKLIDSTITTDNTNKRSTVVYTCITTGYDKLRLIKTKTPGVKYICFTDDPNMKSSDWEIRPIPDGLDNLSSMKK